MIKTNAPRDAKKLSWHIEDIDLSRIDLPCVRQNERLFYLLTSASFVESGADLYTHNLINLFKDDAEVSDWLIKHWEPEELNHGHALKTYVKHVWPEFDWQAAYEGFFNEYAGYCNADALEPTLTEELAARCVVETGTSSLYWAIRDCCNEPVLQDITERIRRDEIGHYKYFYRYYMKYRPQENVSRMRIIRALARRVLEARNSDAECALRHVFAHQRQTTSSQKQSEINREVNNMVRRHMPIDTMTRMLLKPLQFGPRVENLVYLPVKNLTWLALRMPI